MKKLLALVLLLSMLLSVCGCSQKQGTAPGSSDVRIKKSAEQNVAADITYMEPFRDDRAWVFYDVDDHKYWAVIDKSGNIIATFDGTITHTQYENGYSHITASVGSHYIIDTNCNVVSNFQSDYEGEAQISKGGGFFVTKENVSDFNSVGYRYTVYNSDNSVNGTFTIEDDWDAEYVGCGIFKIGDGFYCAKGHTWVVVDDFWSYNGYSAENGKVVLGTLSPSDADEWGLAVLSETGDLKKVYSQEFSGSMRKSNIANDFCVVYDQSSSSRIFSINTATGDVYFLDSAISEKVPDWAWNTDPSAPTENRIIIPVVGADGETYSYIFDTKFTLIAGPLLGSFDHISEGKMCAVVNRNRMVDEVYDCNGNFIFSVSDLNCEYKDAYSCGALPVRSGNKLNLANAFLDDKGNFLFENLNFQGSKTMQFE